MRVLANCLAAVLCAACGQAASPGPSTSAGGAQTTGSAQPAEVTPANVVRVRSNLPLGYEVAGLAGRAAPISLWGFGAGWVAEPPPCGALGDPAGEGAVQGFSASGSGGIVYVVVADALAGLDPALVGSCASWALAAGRTHGSVSRVDPPGIDGAPTVGMATDVTTVVEGGTETRSHADTFVAYLDRHVAYVSVVTDPGSAAVPLAPDVASGLLVETVSEIRG